METPLGGPEQKKIPFDVLSSDEIGVIEGIQYERLPATFSLSNTVFEACTDVYTAFERYEPRRQSKAKQNLATYLKSVEATTDHYDRDFIERSNESWLDVQKDQEFGLQFYRSDEDLVKGRVHTGERKSILLRNTLDGIADNKSVVQIHSHPNDRSQSVADIRTIVIDANSVPKKCLYSVVTANFLHVMFPTQETVRYSFDEFNDIIEQRFNPSYEEILSATSDYEMARSLLIRSAAEYFRLGYYSGPKGLILPRVV